MVSAVELPDGHRPEGAVDSRRMGSFRWGRDFLTNRFVYLFLSPRAGGLTIGVNLNPDHHCNFDCVYCEVHRHRPNGDVRFDVGVMATELERMLEQVCGGRLRELERFQLLSDELLTLRHVALSGEGEPTLCPQFAEAVQAVVHIRARGQFPFFKMVLLTNGSVLDQPTVQSGLRHFLHQDEIWLKLDAGNRTTFEAINRSQVSYQRVLHNIRNLGRQRPVVIQSLIPLINGQEPLDRDIEDLVTQLKQLKDQGTAISLVQIYSATRPTARSGCRHLPLKSLSRIAHSVRDGTGLNVEVF